MEISARLAACRGMDKGLDEQLFVRAELDQPHVLGNGHLDGAGTSAACPVMRKLSGRLARALEGGLLRVEFNGSVGQMYAEPAICRGGDGNHYTLAD